MADVSTFFGQEEGKDLNIDMKFSGSENTHLITYTIPWVAIVKIYNKRIHDLCLT